MKTLTLPADLDGAHMKEWLKSNGDAFVAGDPLVAFELEGEAKQLTAEYSGVLARIMARPPDEAVTFGTGAALAIVTEPGETVGYEAIRTVRVQLRRTCSACGNDYPLNGLVQSKVCPSCRTSETAPAAFWTSYVFEDAVESLVKGVSAGGSVLAGRHGASKIHCASILPLCRKCHQLLAWERFAPIWATAQSGTPGELVCCGEIHTIRAAPEWARVLQPGLLGVLGEQGLETSTAAPVGKPVMFTCPQCAAPLKVNGEKRIVTCDHCNVDVRLPDDLWSHFNPVQKWERWWLLFDPAVPNRTHEDEEDAADDDASEAAAAAEAASSAEAARTDAADAAVSRRRTNWIVFAAAAVSGIAYLVWRATQ